jgi:glycosyltransferase involved in cell wall biosynthesis
MKVLLFTSHYPASDSPTRGTYNRNTFGALAKHCEARVVGAIPFWYQKHNKEHLFRVQRESGFGIDASFQTYWTIPSATPVHGAAMFASLYPLMRKVRREFAYDIILATWAYPDGVAAALFADGAGCPLVTTVLGSDVNELPNHRALRPQIAWGLKRAQRVVSVSAAMGEKVVELGVPRDRVVVQHNGVDGSEFILRSQAEARARLKLDPGRPIVLYVGNVKEEKGVRVLVEAIAPLTRRLGQKDVELCIVGSGELSEPLKARSKELGLSGNIRFCGRQLHTEIPHWMSAADVFCLPSYREGCPNVILEALASGKPVVASRVGGIPELLHEQNGVMPPAGDSEALADGLSQALGRTWDPAALRASVEYLSWDAVGETYRDLLTMVVREWRERGGRAG